MMPNDLYRARAEQFLKNLNTLQTEWGCRVNNGVYQIFVVEDNMWVDIKELDSLE